MPPICPTCQRELPAADIFSNSSTVICSTCGAHFYRADNNVNGDKSSQPQLISIPPVYRIDHEGPDLVITNRWFTPAYLLLPVFCIIWYTAFYFHFQGKIFPTPDARYIQAIPILFGMLVMYVFIAVVCNNTIIRISRLSISVRNVPIPWAPNAQAPVDSIKQIYCRRSETPAQGWKTNNSLDFYYEIVAILNDDTSVNLMNCLRDKNEATFLEKIIERHLGIGDFLVAGEEVKPDSTDPDNPRYILTPKGYSVTERGDDLVITHRWFVWPHLLLFLVNLFLLVMVSGSLIITKHLLILPFLLVALYAVYGTMAPLLNSTEVCVNTRQLSVRHFPLPWPGNLVLPSSEIKQLFIRRTKVRGNHSTPHYEYSVDVILTSGEHRNLIDDLLDLEVAVFYETAIEKRLGIKNRPVKGEANPSAID